MMYKIIIKGFACAALLLLGLVAPALADGVKGDPEVLYKYQVGVDLQMKIIKGLKLDVSPELRFQDGYDKFLLSGALTYKTLGCIYLGATYRLEVDRDEDSYTTSMYGVASYDSDTYHRYAFDVTYKDKFGRFTPSLRVRYNNFTDDEISDKEYLRYRAKVEYDIRKCIITPYLAAEAYQELGENLLYKMRYSTGFDLKVSKESSFWFDYKFDFFTLEYKNANIFSIGYKYKF